MPAVEVVPAVDGRAVGEPDYYRGGAGAWGCLRSHVNVLERALMDDVGAVLVFEDDVTWMSDSWDRLAAFLQAVPRDWDQLMLGGQHIRPPEKVADGVVRCRNAQRTHAYAVRGPALKSLLKLWYKCPTHIDHHMGPWQQQWKVYAPDPFVFGQDRGPSDISGANNPAKFWSAPSGEAAVVHLACPPDVAKRLRGMGLHTGHDRDPKTDLDRGLNAAAESADPAAALKRWLETVTWEAASEEGTVATVWHPDISATLVESVHKGPVIVVVGDTVEACRAAMPEGMALRRNYAHSHIVLLRAPRDVAEMLRGHGWHSGNWRDDVTGHDNGLRRIAVMPAGAGRAAKLAAWVEDLAREAEAVPGGVVTAWHDGVGAEELRAGAGGRAVVEVRADGVDEAVEQFKGAITA